LARSCSPKKGENYFIVAMIFMHLFYHFFGHEPRCDHGDDCTKYRPDAVNRNLNEVTIGYPVNITSIDRTEHRRIPNVCLGSKYYCDDGTHY